MRQLSAVPNIDAADSQYPAGKIRDDNSPTTEGTPVTEVLYGDLIQFIHKLMRIAGLTYNDVEENESNGFQLLTALSYYVRTVTASQTEKGTVELATSAETQAGSSSGLVVTPAGLESKTATESRNGITKVCSDTNANERAGINLLPPSKIYLAVRNGYVNISSTGTHAIANGVGFVKITGSIDPIIRLPDPSNEAGRQIRILNESSNTESTPTLQTYSGGVQYPTNMQSGYYLVFECDGSEWYCVYYAAKPAG